MKETSYSDISPINIHKLILTHFCQIFNCHFYRLAKCVFCMFAQKSFSCIQFNFPLFLKL